MPLAWPGFGGLFGQKLKRFHWPVGEAHCGKAIGGGQPPACEYSGSLGGVAGKVACARLTKSRTPPPPRPAIQRRNLARITVLPSLTDKPHQPGMSSPDAGQPSGSTVRMEKPAPQATKA